MFDVFKKCISVIYAKEKTYKMYNKEINKLINKFIREYVVYCIIPTHAHNRASFERRKQKNIVFSVLYSLRIF